MLPEISNDDIFKINLMILEVISENAETQLTGIVAVADFAGFEWRKHYQYLSPYYAKKSADVIQVSEYTPTRRDTFLYFQAGRTDLLITRRHSI